MAETGLLVIADLTGYTAYLANGEIEHAPTIAGDLLETIVGRLEPPFRLTKLEGDAAFLYAEDGRADPALLVDALEAAYLAFRRRLRSIEAATTCTCKACGLAPRLDLKLLVHHGSFVRTVIAGREELAGSSVILVHRLLKGTGAAASRSHGFALFTEDAVKALGLDPVVLALVEEAETFEHLGDVRTYALDLEQRWQSASRRRQLAGGTQPVLDLTVDLETEPGEAWAYLTSPVLRPHWEGPIAIEEALVGGMRGVGATSQCISGRLAMIEEIVDWQPYEHAGWRLAVPGIGPVEATLDLERVDHGTRIRVQWSVASDTVPEPSVIDRAMAERTAALDRLAAIFEAGPTAMPGFEEADRISSSRPLTFESLQGSV